MKITNINILTKALKYTSGAIMAGFLVFLSIQIPDFMDSFQKNNVYGYYFSVAALEEIIKLTAFYIGGLFSVLSFGIFEFILYLVGTKVVISLSFIISRLIILGFHLGLFFFYYKPVSIKFKVGGFILACIIHALFDLSSEVGSETILVRAMIICSLISGFGFIYFIDEVIKRKNKYKTMKKRS